jgi:hypothetical protein
MPALRMSLVVKKNSGSRRFPANGHAFASAAPGIPYFCTDLETPADYRPSGAFQWI